MSGRGHKRLCPVSAARLEEMYYDEKQSIKEVAAALTPLMDDGKPVGRTMLTRWMDAAGIKRREMGTAMKVFRKQHPESNVVQNAQLRRSHRAALDSGKIDRAALAKNLTPAAIRKGIKASAESRARRSERVIECAYCGKFFKRKAYRVKSFGEEPLRFCTKSHWAKYYATFKAFPTPGGATSCA